MKKTRIEKTTIVLYGPDNETIIILALLGGPAANIFYSDNEDKVLESCGNGKIVISPAFHGIKDHLKAALKKKKMNNQIVMVGDWIRSPNEEKARHLKEVLLSN